MYICKWEPIHIDDFTMCVPAFDVEYIYRFVSLGGLRTKSMTSQRGTLQDGR